MFVLAFAVVVVVVVVVVIALAADVLLSPVDAPQAMPLPLVNGLRASMRIVFVSPQATDVVIDGLLDLEPARAGIPTTWSFTIPENAVLAFATLQTLQRWADDGTPVSLDLSKLSGSQPSIGFMRDDVLVRLSASPRQRTQGRGSTSVRGEHP